MADCGTYAGYIAHKKRGDLGCKPCRDANNAYHRQWRQNNRGWKAYNAARRDALEELRRRHQAEFTEILRTLREQKGDTDG